MDAVREDMAAVGVTEEKTGPIGDGQSAVATLDGRRQTRKKKCGGGGRIADTVLDLTVAATCSLLRGYRQMNPS